MNSIIKIIFVFTIFFSCNSRQKEIEKIVKEWHGKEIIIPQQIEYKVLGCDTVCYDLWDKPYKILTYVDSVGCSSCQMGLFFWKTILEIINREGWNVSVLFVIHSSDYPLLSSELIDNNFNCPVIYDYHNLFDEINNFPPAPFRTFLLDRNNKVLLIGSPANNSPVWDLYREIISKQK
jgi:hypothetical protein